MGRSTKSGKRTYGGGGERARVNKEGNLMVEAKKASTKRQRRIDKHVAFKQKLLDTKTVTENEKVSKPLSIETLLTAIKDEEVAIVKKERNIKARVEGEKKGRKRNNTAKRNDRLRQGRKAFAAVLDHPQFQTSALSTINEHLANTIKMQQSQEGPQ